MSDCRAYERAVLDAAEEFRKACTPGKDHPPMAVWIAKRDVLLQASARLSDARRYEDVFDDGCSCRDDHASWCPVYQREMAA